MNDSVVCGRVNTTRMGLKKPISILELHCTQLTRKGSGMIKMEVAVARAINYISIQENKTKEEVVMMLLIEALTARGIMHPLPKEKK